MCDLKRDLLTAAVVVGVLCSGSYGLIMVGGADKIEDHNQGWPTGTLAAANMDTRVSWWEGPPFGGGQWHFQYVCEDTKQFNKMLEVFSKIEADKLLLVLHNGPQVAFVGDKKRYDWEFTVWITETYQRLHGMLQDLNAIEEEEPGKPSESGKPKAPAPQIDLYLGGGGKIIWEKVIVPCEVTMKDLRPGSVDKKYAGKGLVRATVTDGVTGKPIEKAEIELFKGGGKDSNDVRLTSRTDAEGKCLISGIDSGYYEVTVTAKGYVPITAARYDNRNPSLHDIKVRMLEGVTMSGKVVDAEGKPMERISVTACEFKRPDGGGGYACASEMKAITDSQGLFEIKGVPPGSARFRIRAEGLYYSNGLKRWPSPVDDAVLTLVGTSTLKGEVIGQDGRRKTGKIIYELEAAGGSRVGKWGGSGYIKEDGTFEIKGVPPDDYVIWVKPNPCSERFEPVKEELSVKPGQVYELTLMYGSERKR